MKPKYAHYYKCQVCSKLVWVYKHERANIEKCPFCKEGTFRYFCSKLVTDED